LGDAGVFGSALPSLGGLKIMKRLRLFALGAGLMLATLGASAAMAAAHKVTVTTLGDAGSTPGPVSPTGISDGG
jgi:hypothetical protein